MPPGRRTKLTPERQKMIIDALAVGATHRMASACGGISHDTFTLWMRKGREEGREPYLNFYEEVTRVEHQAAVGWLEKIEVAGRDDWRALAWKLERRFPKDFGLRTTIAGDSEQPVSVRVVYDDAPPAPEEL